MERVRALVAEVLDAPMPATPEPCEDAHEGYCHYDAQRSLADRIRRALAGGDESTHPAPTV